MDDLTKKTKLDSLRKEIDAFDKELLELFEARMIKVMEIADFKKMNQMTIRDESREEKVLEKTKLLKNIQLVKPAEKFMKYMMSISREIQASCIGENQAPSVREDTPRLPEKDKANMHDKEGADSKGYKQDRSGSLEIGRASCRGRV